MAEALGIALPESALMPSMSAELRDTARKAGEQALVLVQKNLLPSHIMTEASFHNAIVVHAAIVGSSNSLIHIPAIACELGIELDVEEFDRVHRVPPTVEHPALRETAGGIFLLCRRDPRDYEGGQIPAQHGCHDGNRKNPWENLEEMKKAGFYEQRYEHLKKRDMRTPSAGTGP
jgi:dihydroxy-acid dehydratase